MIEKTNLRSLREIASEYPIVLIDTSVLCHKCFKEKTYLTTIEEEETELKEQKQFRDLLIDYVAGGAPCFITSHISEEYLKGHYPYKKIIKIRGVHQNRRKLNLCRKIRDSAKERKKLIDIFQEKDKILELNANEHELYNNFYDRHPKLLNYEIGDVDLDFLISGVVTAQTRGSTSLVSNDFDIVRAWKSCRKDGRLNNKKLSFFIRLGMNSFKELY